MANRSYLYSFSQDKNRTIKHIFDISEHPYAVPIVFKILISGNSKIIPSKLFEDSFALRGDFKSGLSSIRLFIDKIKPYYDEKLLALEIDSFFEHLEMFSSKYFLLEVAELDFSEYQVKKLLEEVSNLEEMIDNFMLELKNIKLEELGFYTSSVLYFSMGKEKDVLKIEKSFKNKKVKELQSIISTKPTIKNHLALLKNLTNSKDIDNAIDEILELNPNNETVKNFINLKLSDEKKITLLKYIIAKIANEKEVYEYYHELANCYTNQEKWDLALDCFKRYIINSDNVAIYNLVDMLKESPFNKEKEKDIFKELSLEVKNAEIEEKLILFDIEEKQYDMAYEKYKNQKKLLANRMDIGLAFLAHQQIEKAEEILKKIPYGYANISSYYVKKSQHEKALYYSVKERSLSIRLFLEEYGKYGCYAKQKVDIEKLFESFYPKIKEFKPEVIIELAEDVAKDNWLNIAHTLLLLLKDIKRTPAQKRRIEAEVYYTLSKIYDREKEFDKAVEYAKMACLEMEEKQYIKQLAKVEKRKR